MNLSYTSDYKPFLEQAFVSNCCNLLNGKSSDRNVAIMCRWPCLNSKHCQMHKERAKTQLTHFKWPTHTHTHTHTLAMPLTNGQTFRVFVSKCFCHSACQLKSTDIALCIAFLFRTLMSSNLQHLKTFDMCLVWVKTREQNSCVAPKGC